MPLDREDRLVLNALQQGLTITEEPYRELAGRVGLTEGDVLQRIHGLKERGLIRRIGATFDSQKLGFVSTLCALAVPSDRISEVAAVVNGYPGVTHNYLREHEYNMWFTLTAASEPELSRILQEIVKKTGINKMLNLPGIRTFKVNVKFNLSEV